MNWSKAAGDWIWRILGIVILVGFIHSPILDEPFLHPFYDAVNAVVGDESYVQKFGELPDQNASEQVRIQTHLAYVEGLLRTQGMDHLTREEQNRRLSLLDHLGTYWQAGQFPQRRDAIPQRRPCFIDDAGNICAVGYLIEQSAGRDLAERINKKYQYAYLWDMQDDALTEWVGESGFSPKELAMIQPGYDADLGGWGRVFYIMLPNGQTPCKVDFEDFVAFALAFNATPADPNFNIRADTNSDGIVSFPDFIAFAQVFGLSGGCFQVSGKITQAGLGLENVALNFVELDERWNVVTDSLGAYEIKDLPWGDFHIVPQKLGYVFSPDTLELRIFGNRVNQNFEAIPVQPLLVDRSDIRE
ncbi:MAG: hypothetical protein ACI8V2_003959 [Candidatus Latescibacterota bacterium]|jgi:hypothetical protein